MDNVVKISLVGDVFLSNMDYTKGFGVGARLLNEGVKLLNPDTIRSSCACDVLFGNLESPLIEDDTFVKNGCFAGSVKFTSILQTLGFNILSISNNHILEQGIDGFLSTTNALEKADIKYVGKNSEAKSNIEIIEVKGLKFGFAGFNAIKDLPNPNMHAELTYDNVIRTLDEMDWIGLDYKLVSFHWGDEYIHIPSFEQIALAHKIIDYGADVIIGHHPHVIQPIEKYNNGIIIYSLGNFIFDYLFSSEFKTGMKVDLFFSSSKIIEYAVSQVCLNENDLNSIRNTQSLRDDLDKNYLKMLSLSASESNYCKYYKRILHLNKYYQRLLMKFRLIRLLNKPVVYSNIISVIYKKIRK